MGDAILSEMPFVDFYARLVDGEHGTDDARGPGSTPRGFYTEGRPGDIRVMAVLLNPAQPHADEAETYAGKKGAELANSVWKTSGHHLKFRGNQRSPTLDGLRRDVLALFGRSIAECMDLFMYTNLVRLTTKGNKSPDDKAVRIGADWLREEIALWRPEKVIAYGNDVAIGMLAHGIRVDAMLPHPAARGSSDLRRERVTAIRHHLGLS